MRRHTACSQCRLATPPQRRVGPLPRVPSPALMTATSPTAVPPVSRAEVRWIGYVHARRRRPSSLFEGTGDAPVLPLSCSRVQRDTPVPPCVPQYSHHIAPGARGRPLYQPELVPGPGDSPVLTLIFLRGPRVAPMPPWLHHSPPAGSTPYNPRRRGCGRDPMCRLACRAATRPIIVARAQGRRHMHPTPTVT